MAAPGDLRDLELEVLGWRTEHGETALVCRLIDGSSGTIPARWTDLARRHAVEGPLGVLATPAAWRLLPEVHREVQAGDPRGGAAPSSARATRRSSLSLRTQGFVPVRRWVCGGETSASRRCSSSGRSRSARSPTPRRGSTGPSVYWRRSPRICGPGGWLLVDPTTVSSCSPARRLSPGRKLLISPGVGGRLSEVRRAPAWHTLARTTCATASLPSCCTRGGASSTLRGSLGTTHA